MARPTEGLIRASVEAPAGMHTVYADCRDMRQVSYLPDVVYSTKDGMDLHLQMLFPGSIPIRVMMEQMMAQGRPGAAPVADGEDAPNPFAAMLNMPQDKYPVVVFVQGSAWFKQNCYSGLPNLVDIARMGYIVASVEYRPSDLAPWPGFLTDVKAAIRFLRANAEKYGVDKDRIGIWGDSSGGHTSLLVGSTGWTREFDDDRYPDESSAVRCVVDFYGLSDISKLNDGYARDPMYMDTSMPAPEDILFRTKVLDHPEVTVPANPMNYIHADKDYPPFLIMHGDEDGTVPFNQSVRMYEKLVEEGKRVDFYRVKGAGHGVRMWTDEVVGIVGKFLRAYL